MRFIPKKVLVGEALSKKKGRSKKKRDLVTVISLQTPSQNGGGKAFAVATANFKDVTDGKFLNSSSLRHSGTGWMPLPAVPASVTTTLKANAKRQSDLATTIDTLSKTAAGSATHAQLTASKDALIKHINLDKKLTRAAPITISASVVETQEGSKFLQKFGAFISKNSTEITNPIYEAIDPGTRSTAAITAQTSDDTLRIAAIEAVTAYTAENAKTGIDRSDAKIRVAKIKADAACRGLRNGGFDDIICLGF